MGSKSSKEQVATSRYRVAKRIIDALEEAPLSMTELMDVVKKLNGDLYSMKLIKTSLNRMVKHDILSADVVGSHITRFSVRDKRLLNVDVFLPDSEQIATQVRAGVTRYSGEKIQEKRAKWEREHKKKSAFPLSVGTCYSSMADMNI